MTDNNAAPGRPAGRSLYPPLPKRLFAVWYRHFRTYTKDILSNGFPPFLEPLIFLAGMGLGLARYVPDLVGMSYLQFIATGLVMTSAMFTAAFETTYGTFIRLEFDKVYDGMLAAPLSVADVVVGEALWAATKGAFFSFAVLVIISAFGIVPFLPALGVPLVGFLTGFLFAAIGFLVTSFVGNINHFNFFFTGLLSPMFMFCGTIFPIANLPAPLQVVAEFLPLTHAVRLGRAAAMVDFTPLQALDFAYIAAVSLAVLAWAHARLSKRMVQ
jgi:lipooligosaccharide transport system permease protein